MPTITSAPGVDISYRLAGGSGPPVLFVHATGFCGSVWTPITRRLGDVAECWLMDARAHGSSTVEPGTPLDWDSASADVLAVVDAIASHPHATDAPLSGVGHSMGGALLLLAEASRPGTFEHLWLFEPIVIPPSIAAEHSEESAAESPLAAGARRRRPGFAGRREAYDNYASKPPMEHFDPESLRAYLSEGVVDTADGVTLACSPADEAANYEQGGRHGAFAALPDIGCDVTIVAGDPNDPGPAAFAPTLAQRLPSATIDARTSWGHFAPMEHPAEVAAHIASSLGLEGRGPASRP